MPRLARQADVDAGSAVLQQLGVGDGAPVVEAEAVDLVGGAVDDMEGVFAVGDDLEADVLRWLVFPDNGLRLPLHMKGEGHEQ